MAGLFFDSGIDKGFEKDLKRMDGKMNTFAKNTEKKSKGIGKSFLSMGKMLGGIGLAVGLIAAGKEMLTFSKDVETALTEVGTISQAVTNDFEGYKKAIIDLSKKGGQSAKKLTEAYYDIVSAGNDGAKGLKVLAAAQEAGTAGFVEVATAADGLTTVLNAWNMEASEAGRVSDIFFKTVEKGKTTFPELGQNIAQVAPLAASLGVSFEEVSGAVATITKQGVPTAQAFTQIRSALVGMNEELGDGWAETMTLQEGMQEISDKANGSATEIQKLVGRVEGMSAILSVTGKNASTAADDLDAMRNSIGATGIAADKVLKSSDQQAEILKNNLLATFSTMSDGVQKAFGRAAGGLNDLFSKQAIKNIEDERREVNALVIDLNTANISEETRRKLLERLDTLAPSVAAALIDEATNLDVVSKALAVYNGQMALKILIAEQNLQISKQKRKAENYGELFTKARANLLLEMDETATFLKKALPDKAKDIEAILLDSTKSLADKASEIMSMSLKTRGNISGQGSLQLAMDSFSVFKEVYHEEARGLEKMMADAEAMVERYKKILAIDPAELADGPKVPKKEKTEKEKADEIAKAEAKRLKALETARLKALKQLEIDNQKTINIINEHHSDFEGNEDAFYSRLLDQQLIYLDAKSKLTLNELEKLLIEQQVLETRLEQNPRLKKLKSTYEKERVDTGLKNIPVAKAGESTTGSEGVEVTDITSAFSDTDNLVGQFGDLSTSMVSAFETLNSETATQSSKISGIISLIKIAGELIKNVVTNAYTKEADDLSDKNDEIASRIKGEETINRLVRERIAMELNSSAFLDANYKDRYALALKTMQESSNVVDASIAALGSNLILTATGKGESWGGINETAEEYSFTLDQIINKSDTLSGISTGGTISNILDPADIFGGAASAQAYEDAFNKVEKAFNSTLSSMGKTASDMANFSKEEWVDFYTVLDEGGFIADQGTQALVDGMREAQEAYEAALESIQEIITEIAGSLGDALGDSIVDSIANGTDALEEFGKDFNNVLLDMAKAAANAQFFQKLFDDLQEEMELSMDGGDQSWQDDLLRFYDKLPDAISQSEAFLRDFDQQMQDMGFDGITGGDGENKDLSTAGQIRENITEETGTILAGHIGAMRLSNERLANDSESLLDMGVQNLVLQNAIKENTDYLPAIAENTKKTYQKLGGI